MNDALPGNLELTLRWEVARALERSMQGCSPEALLQEIVAESETQEKRDAFILGQGVLFGIVMGIREAGQAAINAGHPELIESFMKTLEEW